MNRAFCWMLNLSVVSLTTILACEVAAVGQSELPPPSPNGPQLNTANGRDQKLPEPLPPVDVPARPDNDAAPPSDAAVPPSADFRPYLGITLDPQPRDAAVVQVVNPGSPAEQAGLQSGDTIEAINGRRVASYEEVLNAVAAMRPGDRLDIDYSRRIRVSTQAVLDGRPAERRQTARVQADIEPDDLPAPQPPEQLPAPPNVVDRQRLSAWLYGERNYRPYNATLARRPYARSQDAPNAEDNPPRRPSDRPRGLFQRNRDRGLLPWRRNRD